MSRDRTVCMMRIKNEARWIGRNLERTWQVCSKVVLWDDGSTDETRDVAFGSIVEKGEIDMVPGGGGFIGRGQTSYGPAELHFLRSPYTSMVRPKMRRNELRDKNCLWWYVKSAVDFDYVLCLDGDEVLSKKALAAFGEMWVWFKTQTCDWIDLPFIYLWNDEQTRRVDGIYGDRTNPADPPADRAPRLRFPRFFSIMRLDAQQLYDTRFTWLGSRGGIHCGSIPQEGFHAIKPIKQFASHAPVLHYGYLDKAMREAKYTFYNEVDPGNQFEGFYEHIIEKPNQHAPGPVEFAPYVDE